MASDASQPLVTKHDEEISVPNFGDGTAAPDYIPVPGEDVGDQLPIKTTRPTKRTAGTSPVRPAHTRSRSPKSGGKNDKEVENPEEKVAASSGQQEEVTMEEVKKEMDQQKETLDKKL